MGAKTRSVEASAELGLPAAILDGPDLNDASDIVLLIHGITANAMTWPLLISRLPSDVATISVDLRGRGDSSRLAGPWGMANHAGDLDRLLGSLGANQRLLVVGHSMGAFVASTFALLYPDRVRGLILVDGGVELSGSLLDRSPDVTAPASNSTEAGQVLEQVLGPALARLGQTFASRAEYRLFWSSHPAFAGSGWSEALDRYINHDLGGSEPFLASRVDPDAVYEDGTEIFLDPRVVDALEEVECPVELVRAERGMLNQPQPLLHQDVVDRAARTSPGLRVTTVPAVNHYTIVLSPAGADSVAAAVRRQL